MWRKTERKKRASGKIFKNDGREAKWREEIMDGNDGV